MALKEEKLKLLLFDDKNDAEAATIANKIVAEGDFTVVDLSLLLLDLLWLKF